MPTFRRSLPNRKDLRKRKKKHCIQAKESTLNPKQASKKWYTTSDSFLGGLEFLRCIADPTLYCSNRENDFAVFLFHVDDILLLPNSDRAVTIVIKSIKSSFEINESEIFDRFLGMPIKEQSDDCHLRNAPMLNRLLENYKMEICNSVSTLLPTGLGLFSEMNYVSLCNIKTFTTKSSDLL